MWAGIQALMGAGTRTKRTGRRASTVLNGLDGGP
jgi:hypothetical protein